MTRKKPVQTKKSVPRQGFPWWAWLILGVVVGFGAIAIATLAQPDRQATLPAEISVQEAAQLREEGAFVLDVREPEEWNEYHIPGATLIPLGELASRVNELPRDQKIVVYCRSGNRSQEGRDILKQAGFTAVTSMSGGIKAWSAAGLPTVTGP
ncbi:rhodanese-like domain-containing protein [Anaerolinea thermophila]|uniref:rhodanese-like domain-containing protein n=2 Tax=Anaerolinea TaxID=233189 RepID=UPI0026EE499B|nr:rhodanese-like domain-containing protein [Anaerolinea thermophila]